MAVEHTRPAFTQRSTPSVMHTHTPNDPPPSLTCCAAQALQLLQAPLKHLPHLLHRSRRCGSGIVGVGGSQQAGAAELRTQGWGGGWGGGALLE